ncbi:MAG: protein translocase subunit SecD [Gammaproteobacteria bacterium]
MNKYPWWKYVLVMGILILGCIYALPNIYGDVPALQLSANNKLIPIDANLVTRVKQILEAQAIPYKQITLVDDKLVVRFANPTQQLHAKTALAKALNAQGTDDFTLALNLVPATPKWLAKLGARPMKLGLDLRGGVHFLLEVDIKSVMSRHLLGMMRSLSRELRAEGIRYNALTTQNGSIVIRLPDATMRDRVISVIRQDFPELVLTKRLVDNSYILEGQLSPAAYNDLRQYTIEQTMTTLRNRVNELGIAEAIVQQQGANRVAVDLPGIQDATRAKQILGGTATLEFRLVDNQHDARAATNSGIIPLGTQLYYLRGTPLLLKDQIILSGESIVSARSGIGEDGRPNVNITLSGGEESSFHRITQKNIGNLLAIVFIETKTINKILNGETVKVRKKVERLISAPRINSALDRRFQITGLEDPNEARNLALLLRSGSLPTAIDIVQERTVGPSLGAENIEKGVRSLIIGLAIIVIFMAIYYRLFGVLADLALGVNLILMVALLSLLGATLTLPGIAGIVLTVGMAVDANVLIFERIREELRNGMSIQASIHAGYERAFATIVDANVTTLIVAIVLFSIGSGAVKGFAVTLTIGLLTSMLSAITFTRAIVNCWYGGRKVRNLSIGVNVKQN